MLLRKTRTLAVTAAIAFLVGPPPFPGALADQPTSNAQQIEFFEKRVRPVLAAHCYECHAADADGVQAGLRLDYREGLLRGGDTGPALAPGHPDKSELIRAVRYDPDGYQMPPSGKLSERQIADLVRWVADGAVWPDEREPRLEGSTAEADRSSRADHWSFRPIQPSPPPRVEHTDWPRQPVDHFILHELEQAGIEPAPEADKRTWLRRVYFTLIGLPPSPQAVEDFSADASPQAYERVVDRLLASPAHGERWGRHWLDLVRFAETAGNEFDYEVPFAWRYRDYVIRAINADLPYDHFVVEHVAGDLLTSPRRDPVSGQNESVLGTGFYWLGQAMQSPIDVLGEQYDTIENQIDVLCKTFLGVSAACARCHDHKFDPISTRDYYALAGFLRSSRRQFAFIDSTDKLGRVRAQLRELDAAHRQSLARQAQRALRPVVRRVARTLLTETGAGGRLSEYLEQVGDDAADVLHAWARLTRDGDAGSFSNRRDQLPRRRQVRAMTDDAVVFADFNGEYPSRWFVTGQAFDGPGERLDLFIDVEKQPAIRRLLPRGMGHSAGVHGKLRGVLRSPTFTIEHKFIDYLMYRAEAGSEVDKLDPGDIKEGQVHLILDGLQLIRQPIYQGLTIDVDHDVAPRWYRQDVSKWIGHRAYIEITDEDNGVIAVDRIDFSDDEAPPVTPNPLVARLLTGSIHAPSGSVKRQRREGLIGPMKTEPLAISAGVDGNDIRPTTPEAGDFGSRNERTHSRQPLPAPLARREPPGGPEGRMRKGVNANALAQGYQELFTEALDRWASGRLDDGAPEDAPWVALVNWLLEHGHELFGRRDATRLVGGAASSSRDNNIQPRDALTSYINARNKLARQLAAPARGLAMADGTGEDAYVLIRGNHERPGAQVRRGFLEVLGGRDTNASARHDRHGSGRLELAGQLVDRANPLPARVIVNRIWQHHFGRGLVATPDDFGRMGKPPTHPRLLDYLAAELMRNNWSLKHLHRTLALSSTARMSSQISPRGDKADPGNRLWHRMPVRRLEAEAIRDAMLAVSGELNQRMSGPGVPPHLTPFMEGRGRPEKSGPLDGDGRRGVYVNVRRNFLLPMFLVFDYPAPQSTVGRRGVSNVPAQALTMMNNPFFIQQSRRWAHRLLTEQDTQQDSASGKDTSAKIRQLYLAAFARPPSENERAAALEFISVQRAEYDEAADLRAWSDLCHVLINSREFIFVQ